MLGVRSFAFTVIFAVAMVEANKGIINNAFLVLGLDQAKLSQLLKDSNLLSKLGLSAPCDHKKLDSSDSSSEEHNKKHGGGGGIKIIPGKNQSIDIDDDDDDAVSKILKGDFKFNFDVQKNQKEKCVKFALGEAGQKKCHDFLVQHKLEKVEELEFKDFFDIFVIFNEELPKASGFGDLKAAFEKRSQTLYGVWSVVFSIFQTSVTERTSKLNDQSVSFFKSIGGIGVEWFKSVWSLWLKASPAVKSNLAGLCSVTTGFLQSNSTQKIFSFSYNYTYTISS